MLHLRLCPKPRRDIKNDKNKTGKNRINEKIGFKSDCGRYCSDTKGEPEWQVYFRQVKGVEKKNDMLA